jgi:hypothetical protein
MKLMQRPTSRGARDRLMAGSFVRAIGGIWSTETQFSKTADRLAMALGVAAACLRPTAIGSVYSAPICGLILILDVILLAVYDKTKRRLDLDLISGIQLTILLFLSLYLLFRSVLGADALATDAFKGFLINVTFIGTMVVVISVRRMIDVFMNTFALVLIASSISVIVTFLIQAVGLPINSMIVLHIEIPGYGGGFGNFGFPFTYLANEVASWLGSSLRMAGLFREPGVFPPFACWAAAYAYLRRWNVLLVIAPLIASILSLSTIGPLSFYTAACLLLYRFRVPPILSLLIIIAAGLMAWPMIYTMEYIGLQAKIDSKSGSYEDREAMVTGVIYTNDWLFGDGSGWGGIGDSESISLISQLRVFGLIYFVPVIAIYLCALGGPSLWIAGCVPCLIAVAFSQPMSIDAAFLVLFFGRAAFRGQAQRRLILPSEVIAQSTA